MKKGQLPTGWTTATLGAIRVDHSKGIVPSASPDAWFELYSVPAFPSGKPEIVEGKAIGSNKQVVEQDVLLVCKINPRINRVWIVGHETYHPKIASTEWIPFWPVDGLSPQFLRYYLQQNRFRDFLAANVSGVGGSLMRVKPATLRDYLVPIPPPPEQHRIVAKIEELFSDLDAGVAALTRVRAKLKRYRASILKAAVEGRLTAAWRAAHPDVEPAEKLLERILTGRRVKWEADQLRKYAEKGKEPPRGWKEKYEEPPCANRDSLPSPPARWCWTSLGELKHFAMYGPRFSSDAYAPEGKLVLRTTDFDEHGNIDFSTPPRLPLDDKTFRQYQLEPGDLLITRTGSIGTLAVFPGGADAIAGAFLIYYRLAVPPEMMRYLYSFLKSPNGQNRLVKGIVGSGRPNLNMPTIDGIPIPLPPLAEQSEIVAEVDRRLSVVDAVEAEVEHALQRAGRLRQAILKRAFEGGLVPQDPSDEPAAKLLERIGAEREADAEANPTKKTGTMKRGRKKARA